MDITAVLTASAPAEGPPVAISKDLGDAFAGLLATAMVEPPASAGTLAVPGLPACPTPITVPPVCPTPTVTPPLCPTPTLGKTEAPTPPATGNDPLPKVIPTDAVETVPVGDGKPSATIRGRPKVLAPPGPPPPVAEPTAAPEKEAPTKAPNAPVIPLDRSSEEAPDIETVVIATTPSPGTATALLSIAPPQPALGPTPAPIVRPANGPAPIKVATIDSAVPATTPPAEPVPSKSSTPAGPAVEVAARGEAPPRALSPLESPEPQESVEPSHPETNPAVTPVKGLTSDPVQKLEAAPDLDVVPQVVRTAVAVETDRPKANATISNAQIAPVAAEAKPLVVEKPSAKTVAASATLEIAAVATKETDAQGGDEGAQDPAPPQAPPIVKTAATERPEAGADRPPVDRQLVVRQVAERIESLVAARPKNGVTIHLEPRDLGTVTLVVKGIASALDVQVSASDERVRGMIDSSRPEMAQALAPRGIEIRELRVAASSGAAGGATDANRDPNPNPEGRPRPQNAPTYARPKAAEEASARPVRSRGKGVDLLA